MERAVEGKIGGAKAQQDRYFVEVIAVHPELCVMQKEYKNNWYDLRAWYAAKVLADACCDDCAHAQNMVEAIVSCQNSAGKAEIGAARSPEFWLNRGRNYLERYASHQPPSPVHA